MCMNYRVEQLNEKNVGDYARINALSWKQSYKGIVNDEFLDLINTEEEINKTIEKLKSSLDDNSKRFLIKVNDRYAGILRVRKTKYPEYNHCGELGALYLLDEFKGKGYGKILFNKAVEELKKMGYTSMIIGCLVGNPTNNFYKHMGGILVGTNDFSIPNQMLKENLYYFDNI